VQFEVQPKAQNTKLTVNYCIIIFLFYLYSSSEIIGDTREIKLAFVNHRVYSAHVKGGKLEIRVCNKMVSDLENSNIFTGDVSGQRQTEGDKHVANDSVDMLVLAPIC